MRVNQRTVPLETLTRMTDGRTGACWELAPWQRDFVWTPAQCLRLWDSVLRGWPIPPVILWRPENSSRVCVLDGQQRLSVLLGHRLDGQGRAPWAWLSGEYAPDGMPELTLTPPEGAVDTSALAQALGVGRDRLPLHQLLESYELRTRMPNIRDTLQDLGILELIGDEKSAMECYHRYATGGTAHGAPKEARACTS